MAVQQAGAQPRAQGHKTPLFTAPDTGAIQGTMQQAACREPGIFLWDRNNKAGGKWPCMAVLCFILLQPGSSAGRPLCYGHETATQRCPCLMAVLYVYPTASVFCFFLLKLLFIL